MTQRTRRIAHGGTARSIFRMERAAGATFRSSERGAALMLALALLMSVGVITVALLGYAEAGTKAQAAYRNDRQLRYRGDAAIEQGIALARTNPRMGIDAPSSQACHQQIPASDGLPAVSVFCEAPAGSGSGLATDPGAVPEYSVLTLGQRDRESPSYNGSACITADGGQSFDNVLGANLWQSAKMERGIRFSKSTFACIGTRAEGVWDVGGKVFSNSSIVVNAGARINPVGPNASVEARGGCVNQPCTVLPRMNFDASRPNDSAAVRGTDPRTHACNAGSGLTQITNQERCAGWRLGTDSNGRLTAINHLGVAVPLVKRTVPSAADCGTGKVIRFEPGWYSDGAAMSALFRDSRCKNSTFWFQPAPGADGIALGNGYRQGIYYFDFVDGTGNSCNWFDNTGAGMNRHLWCIGADDTYNQKVIGGTPMGWNPDTAGTGGTSTGSMYRARIDGWGTSAIWSNQGGATQVAVPGVADPNPNPATYNNPIVSIDRGLTLQDFSPKVASGVYSGPFNIKVFHNTPSAFDNPQITVTYDTSLFGSRSCGTFGLTKGTNFLSTGQSLNSSDAARLGQCLDHADKINGVKVRFTVGGCNLFCFSGGTISLNGMILEPGAYPDQASFPRPPAGEDTGGDCDPDKPGVQFIFGGDSHMYVADGSVELCAGPSAHDASIGQQIAVYGVPALPPLRPVANPTAYAGATLTSPANSRLIGEQCASGSLVATSCAASGPERGLDTNIRYGGGTPAFYADTVSGGATYTFNPSNSGVGEALVIPPGNVVDRMLVRATYDSNPAIPGAGTGPRLLLPCGGNIGFSASGSFPIGGNTQEIKTLPSCMHSMVNSGFSLTWEARGFKFCALWICNTPFNDQIDGLEVIVETRSNANQSVALGNSTTSAYPVPQNRCITAYPNYWGSETNAGECALLRADQTKNPLQPARNSRGRLSIKGTVYAPSSAIDIDDEDVLYPFFSRGLVARTLMLRGFRYRIRVPVIDIPEIDRTQRAREVLFTACVRGSGREANTGRCEPGLGDRILTRSRVRFERNLTPGTTVGQEATVPKVQWWTSEI